jgi:Bacterial regulatory protein, Fis family
MPRRDGCSHPGGEQGNRIANRAEIRNNAERRDNESPCERRSRSGSLEVVVSHAEVVVSRGDVVDYDGFEVICGIGGAARMSSNRPERVGGRAFRKRYETTPKRPLRRALAVTIAAFVALFPRLLQWSAYGTRLASCLDVMADAPFRIAVTNFKRQLIETALHDVNGNRTRAARALGLKRTYLQRLIHDLGVNAPPPPHHSHLRGKKPSQTNPR